MGLPDNPVRAGHSVKNEQNSDGFWQAIINSLEDELIIVDRNLIIIQANEAFLVRHGKRPDEVMGRYCYEISHGLPEVCRPPHHECPISSVWNTGKPARVTHIHVYDVNNSKRQRYVDIIASPVTDGLGNIIAVTELMRDVTEAKELELKIAEAQRYLSALNTVASVITRSLDLDTVLTSALEKTLEIMRQDTGGILLIDEQKKNLCYRVHHGLSKEYAQGVCFRIGEGVTGKVAQTGKSILVEDRSLHPGATNDLASGEDLKAFASVPLLSKDKVLGVINIASSEARQFTSEDIQLLESISAQIAIAIENARLHQEVQRQDENRGELLREIFLIQEEERKRIARELHDETTQMLASLAASLEAVSGTLPETAVSAKARLQKLKSISVGILDEIYRLIYELRPSLLDDLGLVAATRWLIENNLEAAGIRVNFKTTGRVKRLPTQIETTLFRVIQEAINNIVRHAKAVNAYVTLNFQRDTIRGHIKDDGTGFDVEEALSSKERPRGLGLLGMKERIELLNGTFEVDSHDGGGGTEIDINIPL